MTDKPNNFPVKGAHNTVTKEALTQLEASRPKHNSHLDYTIGGTRETVVHSDIEASRDYALNAGHKRLKQVSEKVQMDHVFTANKGRAKAQFKSSNQGGKTYAEMQREATTKAKTRKREMER